MLTNLHTVAKCLTQISCTLFHLQQWEIALTIPPGRLESCSPGRSRNAGTTDAMAVNSQPLATSYVIKGRSLDRRQRQHVRTATPSSQGLLRETGIYCTTNANRSVSEARFLRKEGEKGGKGRKKKKSRRQRRGTAQCGCSFHIQNLHTYTFWGLNGNLCSEHNETGWEEDWWLF